MTYAIGVGAVRANGHDSPLAALPKRVRAIARGGSM